MNHDHHSEPDVLAETEDYGFAVWRSVDDEEEGAIYHIELGGITLHLSPEEWEDLVLLIRTASS